MTKQQFQRFRLADTIEEVCVRTLDTPAGTDDSSFYVSFQDIQDVFPNALRFKLNGHPIPFLTEPNGNRIQPWRIAFYRDEILDVIIGTPLSSGQNSQEPPLSSTDVVESSNPPLAVCNSQQAKMINFDLALNLSTLEKYMVENKEFSQEMMQMQKQITTLLLEAKEKDDKVILMQDQMLDLQNQALDRLAVLQKHAHAILVQNFELHEYPIPRLFIILPVDRSKWNPTKILENKFRLHFLCECGDHTVEASKSSQNQIHIANHKGYEIRNGTEFFRKYGKYMLILMRALKMGMQTVSISVPHIPIQQLVDAGIDYSISYMETLSVDYPALNSFNSIDDYEGLEGADLRQLGTFLQINDQDRKLGNLYRITIETGHVKWVCIDHYRSTYKRIEQEAFADTVAVNGGNYDSQLGRVTIDLQSRIRAEEFFNALVKARHVYDLDISFPWGCTRADLEAFEKALKKSRVSVLRLDLQNFQASTASKLFSTSTRYEILVRIMEHTPMKRIHIVLSEAFIKLHNLQPKRSAHLHKLSFEMSLESVGSSDLLTLVNSLKTNTTLTTLDLLDNNIGKEGALALSEALKTNTTLTTLNLWGNSIGNEGAQALSEALKSNTTLTTLNLGVNSIGKEGAQALSDALKSNTTLTILDLYYNEIGKGAQALSEALKANITLTTLNVGGNSIGKEGAQALSEALKFNTTLTTLNVGGNSIGKEGAQALSEALKTNITLTTLDLEDNEIGNEGAQALSEALKANTTLTTLDLRGNEIGNEGTQALSEALKASKCVTYS